jgi:hypothetical protein
MTLGLLLSTLMCSAPSVFAAPPAPVNYAELEEKCDDSGSPECCKSAVKSMRAGSFAPVPEGGCPAGTRADQLKCVDSLTWCTPIPMPASSLRSVAPPSPKTKSLK